MGTLNGQVRWALVGTGGYARRDCAPAFAAVDRADLVAVVSSDADRAKAFAEGLDVAIATDDVSAAVEHDDIDAVWIASPSHMHAEHGRIAIEAGKHVLLEKPIALDAREAWELVALAEKAGTVLATGYQARYVPAHLRMKALIDEGVLGTLVMARSFYGMRRVGPPRTWRLHKETARWGTLADIGTHHLDLLRMLVGEVDGVSGFTAHRKGYETEDAATLALHFAVGAVGTLTASSVVGRPAVVVEVLGTEGSLVATGTSPDGQGTATLHLADGEPEDITGPTPLSFAAQLDTVTRAMAGEDVAYATGVDGARNVEILEQIEVAAL
ncbi:MAG: hypothetical protein QOE63_1908 [Acidimicrobiaceae bacterium]